MTCGKQDARLPVPEKLHIIFTNNDITSQIYLVVIVILPNKRVHSKQSTNAMRRILQDLICIHFSIIFKRYTVSKSTLLNSILTIVTLFFFLVLLLPLLILGEVRRSSSLPIF